MPFSPELLPADDEGEIIQKTEDVVGPYELHDFFSIVWFVMAMNPNELFFLPVKPLKINIPKMRLRNG